VTLLRRLLRGTLAAVLGILVVAVTVLALMRWQAARRVRVSSGEAAPGTGRFVRAHDVELFVQERGDPSRPAVVFVHGTGAWSETWLPAMDAVAAAGFHAVALDLPPFGYSQRPDPSRYDKTEQGRRIAALLDALGLERPVLVGHSFGGGPTVEAVLAAPERVRGLVLVDAALGIREAGQPPGSGPMLARAFLSIRPLRDAVVAALLSNPRFTRRLLQSFVADPAVATDERVAIYQRPLAVRGTTRAFGHWLPALLLPDAKARSENPASYAALRLPVVALWGDRDTITPLAQGQRVVGLVPGARLVVLPGLGHIPQIEGPEPFHRALVEALAGLEPWPRRRPAASSAGGVVNRRRPRGTSCDEWLSGPAAARRTGSRP
jgi:pimeloyl-ACP methyl ester carboxylesterase